MKKIIRKDCRDVWNAKIADGAIFSKNDIPFCPTTCNEIPSSIITWEEAKNIFNKKKKAGLKNYKLNSYICFYIDDYKFDGPSGIWVNHMEALKIIKHFQGIITPDYSTYQDFPIPLKQYATYKMRLFGYWIGTQGINVINNVRWGTEETWPYCFDGISKNSIVAIGTVGGSPKKIVDRERFERGFKEMLKILEPKVIIVYGSKNYKCFKEANCKVISFESKTSRAYRRKINEQRK